MFLLKEAIASAPVRCGPKCAHMPGRGGATGRATLLLSVLLGRSQVVMFVDHPPNPHCNNAEKVMIKAGIEVKKIPIVAHRRVRPASSPPPPLELRSVTTCSPSKSSLGMGGLRPQRCMSAANTSAATSKVCSCNHLHRGIATDPPRRALQGTKTWHGVRPMVNSGK